MRTLSIEYIRQKLKETQCRLQSLNTSVHLDPSQQKEIIKNADLLVNQTFVFDKPWDMERCTTPYHLDHITWFDEPNQDPEWCFMLNRMDYLSDLLLAADLTGDRRYSDKAVSYIMDWIDHHPVIEPGNSTRTLDTAMRCNNIWQAVTVLDQDQMLSDEQIMKIAQSIVDQFYFLKDHYLAKYTLSNWGTIQTASIVAVLPNLLPDFDQDPVYTWAKKELLIQFDIQVYPDGMYWEQSTMYHIEACNYGLTALRQLRMDDQKSYDILKSVLLKMARTILAILTPSGTIAPYGDSDEVNALDFIQKTAIALEDEVLAGGCQSIGYTSDNLYLYHESGYQTLMKLKHELSSPLQYDGEDCGIYIVKSDPSQKASYTEFINSSLGSGHGHSDNLHLSIRDQGKAFLIDCGRLTYREDDPLRMELKGLTGHNTMKIDEFEYCHPDTSWTVDHFGKPLKSYVRHEGQFHYFEGAILGCDEFNTLYIRKVFVLGEGIWMIVDEVHSPSSHTLHTRWNLDGDVKVEKETPYSYLLNNGEASLRLILDQDSTVEQGIHSLRYNEALSHDVIHGQHEFTGIDQHVTILTRPDIRVEKEEILQNGTTAVSEDLASGYTFILPQGTKYSVGCFHKEVYQGKKVFFQHGQPLHSKSYVIVEKEGQTELVRLKN